MAIDFIVAPETGIVTLGNAGEVAWGVWGDIFGSPSIESTIVRNAGEKSYKFAAAATKPRLYHSTLGSKTVGYCHGYFRVDNATPSSATTILEITGSANSAFLRLSTGGVLQMVASAGASVNGPTIVADTWYGVEFEHDVSANPNVIKWRIWDATNGWVDQTNNSTAVAAGTLTFDILGIEAGPTSGINVYIASGTCFGTSTTPGEDYGGTAAGDRKVLRYLPTSDGTHSFTLNDFVYGTSGGSVATNATDVYSYLDDADQTGVSTTDSITQAVARTGSYVRVNLADEATENSPVAVAIYFTGHSVAGGANEMHLRVSDDGSSWTNIFGDWATTGKSIGGAGTYYWQGVMPTKPSGGAWTLAAVNGLTIEMGNSDDVSPVPYFDSVSAVVLYGQATASSFDPFGMMGIFGI